MKSILPTDEERISGLLNERAGLRNLIRSMSSFINARLAFYEREHSKTLARIARVKTPIAVASEQTRAAHIMKLVREAKRLLVGAARILKTNPVDDRGEE